MTIEWILIERTDYQFMYMHNQKTAVTTNVQFVDCVFYLLIIIISKLIFKTWLDYLFYNNVTS